MQGEGVEHLNYLRAGSWILFDFANTIYSLAVVTLLLPPTLEAISRENFYVTTVSVLSMIFAGFLVPVIGVLMDRRACSKRVLGYATAICAIACLVLAVLLSRPMQWVETFDETLPLRSGTGWLLLVVSAVFFLANALYQSALVPYNSLLVVVAPQKHWGKISGFGVAAGYFGALFTMAAFLVIGIEFVPIGIVFAAVAMMFFTIPLLIFVPERPVKKTERNKPLNLLSPVREIVSALKQLPKNRNLFFGLLGNFLCVDALNTLILFMSTYIIKTVFIGATPLSLVIQRFMIGLIVSSILWSFVNGYLSDRIGSIRTLLFASIMLAVTIAGAVILVPFENLFFWCMILTGGAGLSGMWIAGRKMVVELCPPEQLGLFLGLYGMTNKVGALTNMAFSALTHFLPLLALAEATSYRIALSVLLLPVGGGIALFAVLAQRLKEKPV